MSATKPALTCLLAIWLLILGGCGGSSESSSGTVESSSGHAEPAIRSSAADPHRGHAGTAPEPANESPVRARNTPARVTPLHVSGGGSAQFRVKGGDNSVQEYGEEAGPSDLRQAAAAVHGYLAARATGEAARACSYLAGPQQHQLEGLAASLPDAHGKDCSSAIESLTRSLPTKLWREITLVDAVALRVNGDHALLIYRGGRHTVYAIPLRLKDGTWKLAAINGSALPGTEGR